MLSNLDSIINSIKINDTQNDEPAKYKYDIKNTQCLINSIIFEDKLEMLYKNIEDKILFNNIPNTSNNIHNFNLIKVNLFPYQINNVNWMINIENKIYDDEYNDIAKEIPFYGGALFDEVGMGKTLSIISLIIYNKPKKFLINDGINLLSKATLIIVPNHLSGQWFNEFQNNINDNLKIINLITKHHYKKLALIDYLLADVVIVSNTYFKNCDLNCSSTKKLTGYNLQDNNINIFNIKWHRIVIDEYHEFDEQNILFKKLKKIKCFNKWILSGTPIQSRDYNDFLKSSIGRVLNFLTNDLSIVNKLTVNVNTTNYILHHFCRNLQSNNARHLQLPTIEEVVIKLNFSDTEKLIYNAYKTNNLIKTDDIFLRQICCHPSLYKHENSTIQIDDSLESIRDKITTIYLADFNKAKNKYNEQIERINYIKEKILKAQEEGITEYKEKILATDLENAKNKLIELEIIMNNTEKPVLYYKNFISIIENFDTIKKEECPICLTEFDENDIGITSCCHLYCYTCIKQSITVKTQCPTCKGYLDNTKITLVKSETNDNKNQQDEGVNKYGTKINFIVNYIKNDPHKCRIIFSQWNDLLKAVGKLLIEAGIKLLYCEGTAYQKNNTLNKFNDINGEYKVLMLSSTSSASGTNLNNAEEVIFLEPVYGNIDYRKAVENQGIGRLVRLSNRNKQIKIIRIIIKDSIEETIFNENNKK